MKMHKRSISITLDQSILDRIKVLAKEDDRSVSQYLNILLREFLNAHDQCAAQEKGHGEK